MIIYLFVIIAMFITVLFMFKNENAYKNRLKILEAMHKYNIEMIKQKKYDLMLTYSDFVEPSRKTILRFWDWGYKHIVPKPVYMKIAKYI